jgi:hypothetical protein
MNLHSPSDILSAIIGLSLIATSVLELINPGNRTVNVWILWNLVRGGDALSGMIIHAFGNSYAMTVSDVIHCIIFVVGLPLSIGGLLKYGFKHLSYVCIGTVTVTLFDVLWLCCLLYCVRRERQLKIHGQVQAKVQTYEDLELGLESCPICIDDYDLGDNIMTLNCSHAFHKECITPWLLSRGNCPICRDTGSVKIGG